jgi:pimeloyl-ACP methyl ester carboxylesterase
MKLSVNGTEAFAATGGRAFDASLPCVVLIHGAGFDHSAWALHSRWFAHHGFSVLVPDLPGHGRSAGPALETIAAMADWISALLDAAGSGKAHLVGHSMGSLIALETAARHPEKVSALSLIGTAATMTVGPDLLQAAEANDQTAIDMVSIWGLGFSAELGGSPAPGLWMHGSAQRVLQHCAPGVLFSDLAACNTYQDALAAAAKVTVPTTVILGEKDLMAERPDELLAALQR